MTTHNFVKQKDYEVCTYCGMQKILDSGDGLTHRYYLFNSFPAVREWEYCPKMWDSWSSLVLILNIPTTLTRT